MLIGMTQHNYLQNMWEGWEETNDNFRDIFKHFCLIDVLLQEDGSGILIDPHFCTSIPWFNKENSQYVERIYRYSQETLELSFHEISRYSTQYGLASVQLKMHSNYNNTIDVQYRQSESDGEYIYIT